MLDQQDINGLLTALTATAGAQGGMSESAFHEVRIYDFARPDNLPSEFLRAMENINQAFARGVSGLLTGLLSEEVQIETFAVEQITFRQFCNYMPERTALCTFSISPLEGVGLLELNPHLAFYLLDRGLGGNGEVDSTPRDFSPLEKGLLEDIFRRVVQELGRAWDVLLPLQPMIREVVNNALLSRAAHAEDRIMVCVFALTLGGNTGMATYALPLNSLDFDRLLSVGQAWGSEDPDSQQARDGEYLRECLLGLPVTTRACLRDQAMTLGMLSALHEGDVVSLDADVEEPVEVRAVNRVIYTGRMIRQGEKLAVQLQGEWMGENYEPVV
ncbi:MAG: Flagellar motor switch protein FliM [bacterium ADurb.Bin429]|nr:MAG: Flagellar motor switch protein FliM [bacterium ADurb.Bin429]